MMDLRARDFVDKDYKHLPVLRAALAARQSKAVTKRVEDSADAA